jgi:hypothetical protein
MGTEKNLSGASAKKETRAAGTLEPSIGRLQAAGAAKTSFTFGLLPKIRST